MANDLDRCITNVATELNLPERDVREIADRLQRERKRLGADAQITNADEALKKFATGEAERTRIAAALARKQAGLNIILRDEWDRDVSTMRAQGLSPVQAVLAKLVGSWHGVTGARKSVSARRIALESDWLGGLMRDVMADPATAHVVKLMRNPKAADPLFRDVVREMRELRPDGKPGVTKNEAAQKLARIFATYSEASRLELNRAGANIGKLEGWSPQSHDARKLLKAGEDRWLAEIKPLLDTEKSFPGGNADEALREVYRNIVTGRDQSVTAKLKGEFTGPANLARSLEKHRVLHFASADSWLTYADKYGRGNIATAVLDHLHFAARKASVMQMLGPNPQVFLDGFLESLRAGVRKDAATDPAKAAKAMDSLRADLNQSTTSAISKAFAEVVGNTYGAQNLTAARISAGIRNVESMAKLGGALISSVTDLVTYAHAMRFQGKTILGGYADAFKALLGGRESEDQRRLSLMLGVFYDSILGDIHSRYSAEDNAMGVMSRAQNAFFKLSGLTWWTDRLTNGFARMSSAWMADHAHLPLAELDDAYRHVLALHGLDGPRWEVARQAAHVAEDGTRYIVPEKVRELSHEAFAGLIPAGTSEDAMPRRLERARRELELDLRSFFADESAYAVLKADDRTRMFAVQGTRPGTTMGEAIRFVMQFKSFPIAYVQRVLNRTMRGGPGMKADYGGLAELVAASLVFGYGAMTAKDALKNRTPKDPTRWETILASLQQGGGIGIYGDFLFAAHDRFGSSPLESAAGPTLGTASNALALWQEVAHGDKAAGDALYFALNNTPFLNLWYSRAAFDLLVLNHIQEWMSPGTLKRREQQFHKDFGQSYIVPPVRH